MPRKGEQENKSERRARYKTWLGRHQALWFDWPNDRDKVRQEVVAGMKADGVLSRSTGWRDVAQLPPLLDELITQIGNKEAIDQ